MEKEVIKTDTAPKAIGPYSQGVSVKDAELCFFSGQIAIDPSNGKLVDGDVVKQTEQVFKNISALLESHGMTFDNVVKCTVFITDMSRFKDVNAEYGKYFTALPPARSCVEVSALPAGALIEAEIIACK